MKTRILILIYFLTGYSLLYAAPVDNRIKIDQFGYGTSAQKIAVISNPQVGYNVTTPFVPATVYQVRRVSDNLSVHSGAIIAWNGGATHAQSGDKVWWYDFSSLTTSGSYYIYDSVNDVQSYNFEINDCVYGTVLQQAMRSFYYQRCGTSKAVPHAHANWQDATACHIGTQQDIDCRLVSNPVAGTSLNLSGGWHDAGDYNKYINFTFSPLTDLLLGYIESPTVWKDNYGIPESGNGIPDVLDEVKYELDWMLKMQRPNGSILHKISITDFSAASPPSADAAFRRYGAATTSATLTGAAMFALAASAFRSLNIPAMTTYSNTLEAAAVNAWTWASANPSVVFNNTGFQNVSAEDDDYGRTAKRVCAAAYLYVLTGNTTYRTYFDANYHLVHLLQWTYAYPFETPFQDGVLYYERAAGATASVVNTIRNAYSSSLSSNNGDNLPAFTSNQDAYRAYMADNNYTWGNNQFKAQQGSMFASMNVYGLNAVNATQYRNAASGFVHYLHGVNPTCFAYISNMGAFGAENSINEFYNSWFVDGSALWDRVGVSLYGPAPGFLPGGANPTFAPDGSFGGTIVPPQNQPIQKSYKDWNTSWPQNSWEITENAIYTNAAYARLLSKFLSPDCCAAFVVNISGNGDVCAGSVVNYSVPLTAGATYLWTVTNGNITAGQGTNIVTVTWNSGTTGTVSVVQTNQE